MVKNIIFILFIVFVNSYVDSCLITNCPKGGKRSGKTGFMESNIKPCISCGPGHTGQCFGPNICCGPFGCLMGSPETVRCQREGMFQEMEPCIAGNGFCRKNSGRCASENICCDQDSCITDRQCSIENKPESMDFYNLLNTYPGEIIEN